MTISPGALATAEDILAALNSNASVSNAAKTAADAATAAANAAQTAANAAMPKVGGTVTATGSTASRTLEDRAADALNVRDFGAKGDGTTDDTAAFQAAFARQTSGHTKIFIPAGTWLVSPDVLSWDNANRLTLLGSGPSTFLQMNGTSGNLISATAGIVEIGNMTVWHPTSGAVTSGYFFNFLNCGARLNDIWAYNGYNVAFWGSGCSSFGARDVYAIGPRNNCFVCDPQPAGPSGFGLGVFSRLWLQGLNDNVGCGILMESGDTYTVSDANIAGFVHPVLAQPYAGGGYLANLFFTNVLADGASGSGNTSTSGTGWDFDGTNGFLSRVFLTNCWGSFMGQRGLYAKNVKTIHVSNSLFIDNVSDGAMFDTGCHNVHFKNNTVSGNSRTTPGANGLVVNAGNVYQITGNKIGPTYNGVDGSTHADSQTNGIVVSSAAITNYTIKSNDLTGNTVGLSDFGGGTINVTKFVSENTTGTAVL